MFIFQLEYRMPQDAVRVKTLQATVWDCDRFQEKIFLGAVTLPLENVDLTTETVSKNRYNSCVLFRTKDY